MTAHNPTCDIPCSPTWEERVEAGDENTIEPIYTIEHEVGWAKITIDRSHPQAASGTGHLLAEMALVISAALAGR